MVAAGGSGLSEINTKTLLFVESSLLRLARDERKADDRPIIKYHSNE